jgi:hypothetical protein
MEQAQRLIIFLLFVQNLSFQVQYFFTNRLALLQTKVYLK